MTAVSQTVHPHTFLFLSTPANVPQSLACSLSASYPFLYQLAGPRDMLTEQSVQLELEVGPSHPMWEVFIE